MDPAVQEYAPMAAQPTGQIGPASTTEAAPPVTVIDLTTAVPVANTPVSTPPDGTIAVIAGYLNIGVGLIVLVAIGLYIAGLGQWITHLKVSGRDQGVEWMESAVRTLFYLIIVLGLVRFAQYHTQAVLGVLAIAVILFGGWAVIGIIQASGGGEDEH